MTVPSPTELVRAYSAGAKKRFGQHFLSDVSLLDRIVAAAGVCAGAPVLEIGPGPGTLTSRLLSAGARVTAVEIDRDAAGFLRRQLPDSALTLVEADALSVDFAALGVGAGWCVAANLPYNVGTQILFRLLEHEPPFERLAVMLQREVAERIVAEPGTKAYGALTLQIAALARATVAFRVKPGAFTPPPKVDSAVVVLVPWEEPRIPDPVLRARFRDVVSAGFAMRRKTLRNTLAARFGVEQAERALQTAGIDPQTRAERLGFDEFLCLAAAVAPDEAEQHG